MPIMLLHFRELLSFEALQYIPDQSKVLSQYNLLGDLDLSADIFVNTMNDVLSVASFTIKRSSNSTQECLENTGLNIMPNFMDFKITNRSRTVNDREQIYCNIISNTRSSTINGISRRNE
jgi:hypothetical protein